VLDNADRSSSLTASLSTVVELLVVRINTMAASRVHWGTQFALVVVLLHFPELNSELEQFGSGHNADLIEE
jgi:uncharacterized membrane protein